MNEITPEVLLYCIIGWMVFETTFDLYVLCRQVKVYQNTKTVPTVLAKVMKQETFHRARHYGLDRLYFEMFKAFLDMILTLPILYFGVIALFWHSAEDVAYQMYLNPKKEIIVSCIFVMMIFLLSYVLEIPFLAYDTFALEGKYGFNKQSGKVFVCEQILALMGSLICLPIIVAGFVWIVHIGGQYFYLWLWLFNGTLILLYLAIYPTLNNNYVPLEKGPLRQSIENLAASVDFPLTQLYVVKSSQLSSHSNAYFAGFGKSKRIVLDDTLLLNKGKQDLSQLRPEERGKGCTDMEVLAVLAHELGHWKMGHLFKNLIILEIYLLVMFVAFGHLYQYGTMYQSIGFEPGTKPIIVGFFAFLYVMAPIYFFVNFGDNMLSRNFEYQADEFAYELGFAEHLASALIKLYADNLKFPVDDWFYSFCFYSHPTLLERLDRLKKLEESNQFK